MKETFEGYGNTLERALENARYNSAPVQAWGKPYNLLEHSTVVSRPVIGSPDPDQHSVVIEVDVPGLAAPPSSPPRGRKFLEGRRYAMRRSGTGRSRAGGGR